MLSKPAMAEAPANQRMRMVRNVVDGAEAIAEEAVGEVCQRPPGAGAAFLEASGE